MCIHCYGAQPCVKCMLYWQQTRLKDSTAGRTKQLQLRQLQTQGHGELNLTCNILKLCICNCLFLDGLDFL